MDGNANPNPQHDQDSGGGSHGLLRPRLYKPLSGAGIGCFSHGQCCSSSSRRKTQRVAVHLFLLDCSRPCILGRVVLAHCGMNSTRTRLSTAAAFWTLVSLSRRHFSATISARFAIRHPMLVQHYADAKNTNLGQNSRPAELVLVVRIGRMSLIAL